MSKKMAFMGHVKTSLVCKIHMEHVVQIKQVPIASFYFDTLVVVNSSYLPFCKKLAFRGIWHSWASWNISIFQKNPLKRPESKNVEKMEKKIIFELKIVFKK